MRLSAENAASATVRASRVAVQVRSLPYTGRRRDLEACYPISVRGRRALTLWIGSAEDGLSAYFASLKAGWTAECHHPRTDSDAEVAHSTRANRVPARKYEPGVSETSSRSCSVCNPSVRPRVGNCCQFSPFWLIVEQLPNGRYYVVVPPENAGRCVVYARVSSADQKDDLDRQVGRVVEWATQQGCRPDEVVKEIGSGLNGNRRRLRRLVADHSVGTIVVEHRERLSRFGFEYVEAALAGRGPVFW